MGDSVTDSATASSFAFLAPYGPLYLRLATVAERALAIDPSLTLVSLRQLSEAFARYAAARAGLLSDNRDSSASQLDLLRTLEQGGIVRDQIAEMTLKSLVASGQVRIHGKARDTAYAWID